MRHIVTATLSALALSAAVAGTAAAAERTTDSAMDRSSTAFVASPASASPLVISSWREGPSAGPGAVVNGGISRETAHLVGFNGDPLDDH